MHITRDDVNRLRADFRDRVLEILQTTRLTQKELADACGVHQTTVHRWFSYEGDVDFPAALTPALVSTPEMKLIAEAIVSFQAAKLGLEVRQLSVRGGLDGSIVDDTLNIAEDVGRLAQLVKNGKVDYAKARKTLEEIRTQANVALLEIERMPDPRFLRRVAP